MFIQFDNLDRVLNFGFNWFLLSSTKRISTETSSSSDRTGFLIRMNKKKNISSELSQTTANQRCSKTQSSWQYRSTQWDMSTPKGLHIVRSMPFHWTELTEWKSVNRRPRLVSSVRVIRCGIDSKTHLRQVINVWDGMSGDTGVQADHREDRICLYGATERQISWTTRKTSVASHLAQR